MSRRASKLGCWNVYKSYCMTHTALFRKWTWRWGTESCNIGSNYTPQESLVNDQLRIELQKKWITHKWTNMIRQAWERQQRTDGTNVCDFRAGPATYPYIDATHWVLRCHWCALLYDWDIVAQCPKTRQLTQNATADFTALSVVWNWNPI